MQRSSQQVDTRTPGEFDRPPVGHHDSTSSRKVDMRLEKCEDPGQTAIGMRWEQCAGESERQFGCAE